MTADDFNRLCAALPAATRVVQWGGAQVWKVGGKVFAIGGWSNGDAFGVSFKVTPHAFEILRDRPGLRPAPYLASRGMGWIQRLTDESMDDAALAEYLAQSHRLVATGLTRARRREIGFDVA